MKTALASRFEWALIDSQRQRLIHADSAKGHIEAMLKVMTSPCVVKRIEWRCAASTEEALAEQNQKVDWLAENDALRQEILQLKESSREQMKMFTESIRQMIRCSNPNEEQAEAVERDVVEEFRRLTEEGEADE